MTRAGWQSGLAVPIQSSSSTPGQLQPLIATLTEAAVQPAGPLALPYLKMHSTKRRHLPPELQAARRALAALSCETLSDEQVSVRQHAVRDSRRVTSAQMRSQLWAVLLPPRPLLAAHGSEAHESCLLQAGLTGRPRAPPAEIKLQRKENSCA